jgi:hypothetical protein
VIGWYIDYWMFLGRGRRREEDGEGHGATERGAVVLVALVVAAEHLVASDLHCCLLHGWNSELRVSLFVRDFEWVAGMRMSQVLILCC